MSNRLWRVLGFVALFSGIATASVGFVQPGLSCPDDDASAGCPASPFYSGLLGIGLALVIVGILFLVRAGKPGKLV